MDVRLRGKHQQGLRLPSLLLTTANVPESRKWSRPTSDLARMTFPFRITISDCGDAKIDRRGSLEEAAGEDERPLLVGWTQREEFLDKEVAGVFQCLW